jgi:hypothetical protein
MIATKATSLGWSPIELLGLPLKICVGPLRRNGIAVGLAKKPLIRMTNRITDYVLALS